MHFIQTQFSLFESRENIPKYFFIAYKRITKENYLIANKNEDYNSTDVTIKGMADKQLIFGGFDSTNKFGFIYYNSGGMIITSKILIFDIKSKKMPKFLSLYLDDHPLTFQELKISVMKKM